MFFACGIWCLADVLSVSPSSQQTTSNMRRKTPTSPIILAEIKQRRWNWIGNVIRINALRCNFKDRIKTDRSNTGRRRRGRPKETWRRSFIRTRNEGEWMTWAQVEHGVEHLARNRGGCRSLVLALCATRHEGS